MFFPLSLLITAIFSAFVWAERLRCGRFVTSFFFCYICYLDDFLTYRSCTCLLFANSILGGIMIVGGLYSVLWGRSKEGTQQMLKSEPPGEKSQDVERGWSIQAHHFVFLITHKGNTLFMLVLVSHVMLSVLNYWLKIYMIVFLSDIVI